MDNFWIIGHPVASALLTPVMNGCFEVLNLEAKAETKDLDRGEYLKAMDAVREGTLKGLVVTSPYKTETVKNVDQVSEEGPAVHAVNLVLKQDGKLMGYNIDWMGAREVLKQILGDIAGLKVLVLGAGGAARAAAFACHQAGAQVAIWNRTGEKARLFAEELGLEWVEDLQEWESKPQVIINATAVSDLPRQSSLVPFPLWSEVQLALDSVYGTTSLFLEEAGAMNVAHVVSGEEWFVAQFVPFFKLITGKEAPLELVKELVRQNA